MSDYAECEGLMPLAPKRYNLLSASAKLAPFSTSAVEGCLKTPGSHHGAPPLSFFLARDERLFEQLARGHLGDSDTRSSIAITRPRRLLLSLPARSNPPAQSQTALLPVSLAQASPQPHTTRTTPAAGFSSPEGAGLSECSLYNHSTPLPMSKYIQSGFHMSSSRRTPASP
jgi:hypothetical protein